MGVNDFFNNIILSLNTKDEGFSYRKMLAFVVIIMTVYLHIQFANKDNVISFLAYDFGFIAVLLGLLNLDRFVALKFGQTGTTEPVQQLQLPADGGLIQGTQSGTQSSI